MQKMYVIVREDLSDAQKAVQAGHALAQYILDHPGSKWNNGTLVYLRLPKDKLERYFKSRNDKENVSFFIEPDIGNELTAIAFTEPTREVKRMKLL